MSEFFQSSAVEEGTRPGKAREEMRKWRRERLRAKAGKHPRLSAEPLPEHRTSPDPIPAKVYVKIAGLRYDHSAPFLWHAAREKWGPCPFTEWTQRYRTWLERPITG